MGGKSKRGRVLIVTAIVVLMMSAQVLYAENIQVTYPNSYNDYWAPAWFKK